MVITLILIFLLFTREVKMKVEPKELDTELKKNGYKFLEGDFPCTLYILYQ